MAFAVDSSYSLNFRKYVIFEPMFGPNWNQFAELHLTSNFRETEFFLMLDHLHLYNIFQSWIYRCSFKENLKNSRCRIKFAGSESMIYEGPVISAEIQPLKVKMERLGLIVPSNAVRRSLVNQKILVSVQMIDPCALVLLETKIQNCY